MSQRTEGVATQARFAGLGLAAFTTFALLTAHPTAALAAEDDGTTPADPIDSTLVITGDQDPAPEASPEAEPEDTTPEADGDTSDDEGDPIDGQDTTDDAGSEDGDDLTDDTADDAGSTTDGDSGEATTPADTTVAEGAATETTEGTKDVEEQVQEQVQEQVETVAAPAKSVAAAAASEPKTIKKASPDESGDETPDEEEKPKKTYEGFQKDSSGTWRYYKKATTNDKKYAKSGCFYDEDSKKLYYVNSEGVARVLKKNKKYLDTKGKKLYVADSKGKAAVAENSHFVDKDGYLYNVDADGVARKISLKGKYLYKCADGFIFFSKSKDSSELATGKKGWTTSSTYGFDNKTYYFFRTSRGYLFTKYGFSKAGSFGVLANEYGYARTENYRKGNKLYLIRSSGKMLIITDNQEKTFGYKNAGFRWATCFGDKTCQETYDDNELYFLHKNTSSDPYLKGAYYVVCGKSGLKVEKAGKGLSFKNYNGKTSTYKGSHANTPYGAILRSVYDPGHSTRGAQYTVRGDLPVIYKKTVYMTDLNGALRKQTSKDWTTQQRQASNVVRGMGSGTNFAITMSKNTYNVYGWYRPDSKSAWIPLFQTMCSYGAPYTDEEGVSHPTLTPSVTSATYNRYLYFSGCCYYATGFCNGFHMHSTTYYFHNGARRDSRLGQRISHGCIRMNYNYARYIYKYIPMGTRTCVYG